ncbi:MAG: glycerol-3-phosphate 1-O-acyltransferase PlsY [Candidatus Hydrogenedentes bacterium]|nr:glycerol-3-phosphate 1-O-acyltransferase PlsY [Candidatus Hydrogenedentota bacterium]
MTVGLLDIAAVGLSYVLGSLPTGLWLGLWLKGVDIREHGSRNIGATNTMRVLGKKLGVTALVCDMAKGLASVVLVARLGNWDYLPLACGLAAILGHTFSIFLRFRGGKGVATSAGVFLGMVPLPTLIAVAVFGGVVAVTRMVSAGSVAAAAVLAAAVFVFPVSLAVRAITVVVAVLVIVKHRSNLQRIIKGEENRI